MQANKEATLHEADFSKDSIKTTLKPGYLFKK